MPCERVGQRSHGLTCRERSARTVEGIHGHAAPLLVRDIHQAFIWMETVVARAVLPLRADYRGVIRRQVAGARIEMVLVDGVYPLLSARGQKREPPRAGGDMRQEGVSVGRVGLKTVCS